MVAATSQVDLVINDMDVVLAYIVRMDKCCRPRFDHNHCFCYRFLLRSITGLLFHNYLVYGAFS